MQEHNQADRDRASFTAMVEGAILDIYDRLQLAKRQSKFNNQVSELRVIGAMVGFHIASFIGDLRQECEREGQVKGEQKDTAAGIQRLYSDIYTSQKKGEGGVRVPDNEFALAERHTENNINIIELKEISTSISLLFENWRVSYRQECEREGKLKGEQKSVAAALQRQLTKRFGPLSQETQDRIANASLEQLYTWVDRMLDTPNLDEVLEMA
jgi:hypothetical protein